MNIFFTHSTQHLIKKMNITPASFVSKQFSDGELYVKIEQTLDASSEVWVMASTIPPAENSLELFLLLDALVNAGAQKINIFFTYFGYARQTFALPGEARSAQLFCDILKKFPLGKVYIMHAHAAEILKDFLKFTNVIDMDFFCTNAKNYDVIVAPDQGAAEFAHHVAQICNKEIVVLQKKRYKHDEVIIESVNGNVKDKKLFLVDDMISTGRTLIKACHALKKLGALEVSAAATHGIFSGTAYQNLQESPLKNIYVTNTLPNNNQGKIEVTDISDYIKSIIVTS